MTPLEKLAYQVGVKLALESASDELGAAARNLYGIAGGLAGAVSGGFLGRYLGQEAADAFDLDEDMSGAIGTGLGALAGAGLGGAAGSNLATMTQGQPGEVAEEPAYEPEPEYPTVGMSPLDQMSDGPGLGLMEPFYDVTQQYSPQDMYGLSGFGDSGGYDDYGYNDYSY
jgi:hypothetical protein